MKTSVKIAEKLKDRSAFTIAETLIAIIILMLVSTLVAAGIPSARRAYEGVVKAADAELLLSTTISTLRNELSTAKDINIESNTIKYYNGATGAYSKISKNTGDSGKGEIQYQKFATEEGLSEEASAVVPLITQQASTEDLYVTYGSAVYADGIVTFSDIYVRDNSKKDVTGQDEIKIRIISY